MSKWMSIGFDPDEMDPTTEPKTEAAMGGSRDSEASRPSDRLDETLSEVGAVSGRKDSSKR
jgi:hypothetical protein